MQPQRPLIGYEEVPSISTDGGGTFTSGASGQDSERARTARSMAGRMSSSGSTVSGKETDGSEGAKNRAATPDKPRNQTATR